MNVQSPKQSLSWQDKRIHNQQINVKKKLEHPDRQSASQRIISRSSAKIADYMLTEHRERVVRWTDNRQIHDNEHISID